jgi:hypothetical protein
MCVATFPGSGVAMPSVASAVRDAAISGSSLVAVPSAIAARAASSGVGVRVPWRAVWVSVKRVSGDAPPQPLARRVRARLARKTQRERGRTTAQGGEKDNPYEPVRTIRSRPRDALTCAWRGSCNCPPPAGRCGPPWFSGGCRRAIGQERLWRSRRHKADEARAAVRERSEVRWRRF